MTPKICVYAICKNEEKFIQRWFNSVCDADYIYVLDTGSTDSSVEILKSLSPSVTLLQTEIKPWRFDKARNYLLNKIPAFVDICISLDMDEVMSSGWKESLCKEYSPEINQYRYNFVWRTEDREHNIPEVSFSGEKIHTRKDWTWKFPVHETLTYTGECEIRQKYVDLTITHLPDNTKSRAQYLDLLELAKEEHPLDDRVSFYLAREYKFCGRYQDAINEYIRYTHLPASLWPQQNATVYMELGKLTDDPKWFYKAIAECPTIREVYLDFAQWLSDNKDFEGAIFMCKEALKITEQDKSYLNDITCWQSKPFDILSVAHYWLHNYTEAYQNIKIALSWYPEDVRLLRNYYYISEGHKSWK